MTFSWVKSTFNFFTVHAVENTFHLDVSLADLSRQGCNCACACACACACVCGGGGGTAWTWVNPNYN